MLQLVLRALNIQPSLAIYVRHSWPANKLTHPSLFNAKAAAFSIGRQNIMPFPEGSAGPMQRVMQEIREYHFREYPHLVADIVCDLAFQPPKG